MMFPHTITVFTPLGNGGYERYLISGVYWYGISGKTLSGKGKEATASVKIAMPIKLFKGIEKGSYIVKGNYPEIKSIKELDGIENCITVQNIDINDVGSTIDNVVITGV